MQVGQQGRTIRLQEKQWVALVYIHADSTPLLQLMAEPLPEMMEVGILEQAKVLGPNQAPAIRGDVKKIRLVKAMEIPSVPLAVYFCEAMAKNVAAREEAIRDVAAKAAAQAVSDELSPTLGMIRNLPVAPREPPL